MLLLCVLAAAPLSFGYREATKTYEVTDWSKETRVFVAAHEAPLYDQPDGGVASKLRFGAAVKILSALPNRWYRVGCEGKAGYLPGDSITSARYEDDFDGDGENELATVAFTPEFKIRVRFFEPKEKTETFVDVEPAGGAFIGLTGGFAYPDLVAKSKAGLPLVHVDTHVEACADFADFWVSYSAGTPRVALTLRGIADPPAMSGYKVEFKKGLAIVKREQAQEEDAPPKKWTERWTLDGGVFTKRAE